MMINCCKDLTGSRVELQHWMYLNLCSAAVADEAALVELQHWMYLNSKRSTRVSIRLLSNYNIGCI